MGRKRDVVYGAGVCWLVTYLFLVPFLAVAFAVGLRPAWFAGDTRDLVAGWVCSLGAVVLGWNAGDRFVARRQRKRQQ